MANVTLLDAKCVTAQKVALLEPGSSTKSSAALLFNGRASFSQRLWLGTIQLIRATPEAIELRLTAATDPAFYDLPLTLSTSVPSAWKAIAVTQGTANAIVPVHQGRAVYAAQPGGPTITLRPAI